VPVAFDACESAVRGFSRVRIRVPAIAQPIAAATAMNITVFEWLRKTESFPPLPRDK
jgi:hypothetical protein